MNQELSETEIENIRKHYPINFKEHLARVRRLLKSAQPGNVPWRILENDYGFSGDYVYGQDDGEPPFES